MGALRNLQRVRISQPQNQIIMAYLLKNRYQSTIRVLLLTLSLLIWTHSAFAIEENTKSRIMGRNICDATVFLAEPLPSATNFTLGSRLNTVTLGIHQDYYASLNASEVSIQYNLIAWEGGIEVINLSTQSLIITHAGEGIPYSDKGYFQFGEGDEFQVQVTGVFVDGDPTPYTCGNGAIEGVYLELEAQVNRVYDFDRHAIPSPASISETVNTATGELALQWNKIPGAVRYDLEWKWVDDVMGITTAGVVQYRNEINLEYNFEEGATRVSIPQTTYHIPLVFEHGYLLYRIRPKGESLSGTLINGRWSTESLTTNIVADLPNKQFIDASLVHEPTFNWQFIQSFREEGRQKNVIDYLDGGLATRQKVGRNSTEGFTLVHEHYRDLANRPVVAPLITPIQDQNLQYHEQFNMDVSGNPYTYRNFAAGDAQPFSQVSGTGQYYSPSNPDMLGVQAYVPDAEGYPFSQIQMVADGTGRPRKVSKPGLNLRMGSGRETEFMYGVPFQIELDRVFGNEVGFAKHYKKNVVIDPNGQITISYLDSEGRVIANCLAGDAPESLDPLPSNTGNITADLTDFNELNLLDRSLKFSYAHLVPEAGDQDFFYDLTAGQYSFIDPCELETRCQDCVYDLEISITDEQGIPVPGTPISSTIGNCCGADFDCQSPGTFSWPAGGGFETIPFNTPGIYTVTKTLRVNPYVLTSAVDEYMDQVECVDILNDFIEEETERIGTCDIDCNGCDPSSIGAVVMGDLAIGTPQPTTQSPQGTNITVLQVPPADNGDCESYCTPIDKCAQMLDIMLRDVSPGGQYCEYERGIDQLEGEYLFTNDPLSIMDAGGSALPDRDGWPQPNWENPFDPDPNDTDPGLYMNESNQPAEVYIPGEGWKAPAELTGYQFVDYFQPSWALSLVQFHPEYCYYEWCVENKLSLDYDQGMLAISSYQEALEAGYFRPLGNPASHLPLGLDPGYVEQDPYFQSGAEGYDNRDQLLDEMEIWTLHNGIDISIWEMAWANVVCTQFLNDGPGFDACLANLDWLNAGCDLDQVWVYYRTFYLSKKWRIQDENKIQYSIDNGCYNGCIGSSANVPNEVKQNNIQPCSNGSRSYYQNKVARFPSMEALFNEDLEDIEDYGQVTVDVEDQFEGACTTQCEAYIPYWTSKLEGCNLSQNDLDQVLGKFLEMCIKGCDPDHTMGASSIPVGSPVFVGTEPCYSFECIFNSIVGSSNGDCNVNLIQMPPEYEIDMHFQAPYNLDNCVCDNLEDHFDDYLNMTGFTGTFADWINYQYNSSYTQEEIEYLQCECGGYRFTNEINVSTVPLFPNCNV